jgi:hypothetical protein
MNDEQLQALLKGVCQHLGEHFTSIQIIATKHDHETGESDLLHAGYGDQFARVGATTAWLDVMEFLTISDGEGE